MPLHPASAGPRTVRLHRADGVDYQRALDWQIATAEAIRAARADTTANGATESLALIQHQPVYTLGARADGSNLLVSRADLAARDAQVIEVDRGGDVTFHGPGQLVVYPILDLHARGLRPVDYVRLLEQTAIDALEAFDLRAERIRGRPGVWIDNAKVAAIGVRVTRGVSTHGLALNVDLDLGWFDAIVPCGLADAEVTSIARQLDRAPGFDAVVDAYRTAFEQRFAARLVEAEWTPLGAIAAEAVSA